MPKAYLYIRVSSLDQARQGYSLEHQEAAGRRYYEFRLKPNEVEWGGIIVEGGTSAYKKPILKRKGGLQLNGLLKPGDHVVFLRMCRGFRNLQDFVNVSPLWTSRGVTIHFVDQMVDLSTANGKLFAHLLAAVAQWESDIKSERMREVMATRLASGTDNVKIRMPDGRKVLRHSPEFREIANEVIKLRDGGMSWRALAKEMDRRHIEAAGGVYQDSAFKKKYWSLAKVKMVYRYENTLRAFEAGASNNGAVHREGLRAVD